jgi:hypothetical protein
MGSNQTGLRASLDATAASFVGLLCLFLGGWMVAMTGYLWAALPILAAGAVIFPATRGVATFGALRVGPRLHDFLAFMLFLLLLFVAVLVAQPWA